MNRARAIRWALLLGVVVVMGGIAYAAGRASEQTGKADAPPSAKAASGLPVERVMIQGKQFDLEVAATEADIARGLSKRTSIDPGTGMIFVFPGGSERSFWMIDCLVDMDIAFLSPDGTVLAVHEMKKEELRKPTESKYEYEARLKRYLSGPGAQFAIETPAGTSAALKIVPGTKIQLDRKSLLTHWRTRNSAARAPAQEPVRSPVPATPPEVTPPSSPPPAAPPPAAPPPTAPPKV